MLIDETVDLMSTAPKACRSTNCRGFRRGRYIGVGRRRASVDRFEQGRRRWQFSFPHSESTGTRTRRPSAAPRHFSSSTEDMLPKPH